MNENILTTHIIAFVWVATLLLVWFMALSFASTEPTLRDTVMVGAGVFLAMLKDIAQFIWRKRPGGD